MALIRAGPDNSSKSGVEFMGPSFRLPAEPAKTSGRWVDSGALGFLPLGAFSFLDLSAY